MAGTRFSAPIDLNAYDLVRARLERLATDPTSTFVGRVWFNTTSAAPKVQRTASVASLLAMKYAVSVGDGAETSYTVTHNLGTLDVNVEVFVNATGVNATTVTSITRTSANVVTIVFSGAPASNAMRVVVTG